MLSELRRYTHSSEDLQDVDKVLFSFAASCLAAGPNCILNAQNEFATTSALLAKIDGTLDALSIRKGDAGVRPGYPSRGDGDKSQILVVSVHVLDHFMGSASTALERGIQGRFHASREYDYAQGTLQQRW